MSVSHRRLYPWVFFGRDRHITFHAVNQSGMSTSMTEAISHIKHSSSFFFLLNMESLSSLPYLVPYLVAVL